MKVCAAVVVLLLSRPVHAADASPPLSREELRTMVNALADCAGLYQIAAKLADGGKQPATAERMRGLERGAKLSAQYLLAQEYAKKHEKPKPLGYFANYTDGRVETSSVRFQAMVEQQDLAAFKDEIAKCNALSELQESIVQEMRDGFIEDEEAP